MFNLIVAVISIALIAVMAVAGIFYAGSAFSNQTQKTEYATIANAASQIKGAMEIYRSQTGMYPAGIPDEGADVSSTDALLSYLTAKSYLSSVPSGDWVIGSGYIQRSIEDEAACGRTNLFAGFTSECPSCSDPTRVDFPACTITE